MTAHGQFRARTVVRDRRPASLGRVPWQVLARLRRRGSEGGQERRRLPVLGRRRLDGIERRAEHRSRGHVK